MDQRVGYVSGLWMWPYVSENFAYLGAAGDSEVLAVEELYHSPISQY